MQSKAPPKHCLQSIAIFQYYVGNILPSFSSKSSNQTFLSEKLLKRQSPSLSYIFSKQETVESLSFDNISPEEALHQVKRVQLEDGSVKKIGSRVFVREENVVVSGWIGTNKQIKDIMEFVFISHQRPQNQHTSHKTEKQYLSSQLSDRKSTKQSQNSQNNSRFSIYIIHTSEHWENVHFYFMFQLIQRFKFSSRGLSYQMICAYVPKGSWKGLWQEDKIVQTYIKTINKAGKAHRVLGGLQKRIQIRKKESELQENNICYARVHRRQLTLPSQHFSTFKQLQQQVYPFFNNLNPKRPQPRISPFLDNTIVRLMGKCQFKYVQTLNLLKQYFIWQHGMRQKYQKNYYSIFQQFIQMDIFTYLGKDCQGRPVILNKARHVHCPSIKNDALFVDFNLYYLQIWMQDHMEGYVDTFVVLGDMSDQTSDNTNLSVTKEIILTGMKFSMGKHHRIIAFDVGFIGYGLFHMFKPLLPTFFIDNMRIISSDREELRKEVCSLMNPDIVPEYAGGNKKVEKEERIKDPQELQWEKQREKRRAAEQEEMERQQQNCRTQADIQSPRGYSFERHTFKSSRMSKRSPYLP